MFELFGRRKIYTPITEINESNILDVVNNALTYHIQNFMEEDFLYWYRRGKQPILYRHKEIRPEICNKVVVNNADMVVTFKNGYFLTKPAFYVSRKEDSKVTDNVKTLNKFLFTSGKNSADNEVIDWFHTVGLGALYVEPNKDTESDSKVNVYCVDPRSAFVIYSLQPGNRPMVGVNMVVNEKEVFIDAFTENAVYRLYGVTNLMRVTDDTSIACVVHEVRAVEPNIIGMIPIVEYQYNENRMSAFESAISIMDEINNVESNAIDGIEQFVQNLIVTTNVEFADENTTANDIRKAGMINLKSSSENKADFKILSEQLDQNQAQVMLQNLYEQMLDKCGVPSSIRDSGSTSDNVGAVYLRSGWAMADTHARNCEDCFIKANRYFDKLFLKILKTVNAIGDISVDDFELKIVRNDMSNLLVKTQAAMNMKELGFAPAVALERSGLSNDPITDIELSKEYIDSKWLKSDSEEGASSNLQGNFVAGYYRGDCGSGEHKNTSKVVKSEKSDNKENTKDE